MAQCAESIEAKCTVARHATTKNVKVQKRPLFHTFFSKFIVIYYYCLRLIDYLTKGHIY